MNSIELERAPISSEMNLYDESHLTDQRVAELPSPANLMLSKPILSTAVFAASLLLAIPAAHAAPPAAADMPPEIITPGALTRMLKEADEAFTTQKYPVVVAKLQAYLAATGQKKDPAFEILYFNIGLANLLGKKVAEAELAFTDCIQRFPQGEYTSRCNLGLGRACVQLGTPAKLQQAITAFKTAELDPKYRAEAKLGLGQVYSKLGKPDEALDTFRSMVLADVRTPQQTTAAVEVIRLLATTGKIEDLIAYLNRLSQQAGVRDALAWYSNQVIVRGDELVGSKNYDSALAIYRSIPPRLQIIEVQTLALASMRKDQSALERTVDAEKNKPIEQHSKAAELLASLKPAIELAASAMKTIEEKSDLDAAVLMRRGRCLFYLDRYEEALVCFRTLRTLYGSTPDAQSAAYAEIVIFNKLNNTAEIKEKCEQFIRNYPNSENLEQVMTLAGEVLIQSKKWKALGSFYRGLETKFPKSANMERYVFFQGVAFFMEANFKESSPIFVRFLKDYPTSPLVETALYYMAMSNFLSNKSKEATASCNDYLKRFPEGSFAGDMRYRLSFIDFNDKEQDQSDKIIRDLTAFVKTHADDLSNGSILCLLADTYKKKKSANAQEAQANEDAALEAYKKALKTDSMDDIMQYALDSATAMMQKRKDWAGIAAIHSAFMTQRPTSPLALMSASWVARMKSREGKSAEAADMLADAMKTSIADAEKEQVEYLIDELVKTLVPKKKSKDLDADAIDKQLVEILGKIIVGKENATTVARVYYARARLAQMLKRNDRADLYLKGIATTNAKDPSKLSPVLLSVCGEILLKIGDLDGAEAMFRRLADRYSESMFSDAGPVGLGYVALARKQAAEALTIFDTALDKNAGMSRFKEATLGKLQALVALDRLDIAEKLALSIVGDKMFRGETSGKAYILLGQVYRKMAAKAVGSEASELLKKAHGIYQRVYIVHQSVPDVCAEAYWQAYETAKELADDTLAKETLKALSTHPKLQNTQRAKDAVKLVL